MPAYPMQAQLDHVHDSRCVLVFISFLRSSFLVLLYNLLSHISVLFADEGQAPSDDRDVQWLWRAYWALRLLFPCSLNDVLVSDSVLHG